MYSVKLLINRALSIAQNLGTFQIQYNVIDIGVGNTDLPVKRGQCQDSILPSVGNRYLLANF